MPIDHRILNLDRGKEVRFWCNCDKPEHHHGITFVLKDINEVLTTEFPNVPSQDICLEISTHVNPFDREEYTISITARHLRK